MDGKTSDKENIDIEKQMRKIDIADSRIIVDEDSKIADTVDVIKSVDAEKITNLRVAMLGNVDSGKSTLSGVLTSAPGTKDDGRGLMRSRVFNFAHEQSNGRTSSVAHEIMGFEANGEQYVTKVAHTSKKNKIWPDIVQNSSKIIHLLDMCGHEKYLKTTMHGLTSLYPDYCLLVIGANMGISKMTKEHLGLSWALSLPVIVVFTKLDLAPAEVYKENLKKITKIIKTHLNKVPVKVNSLEDVEKVKANVGTGQICPIFSCSSFTGEGIDLIRRFMAVLPKSFVRTENIRLTSEPAEDSKMPDGDTKAPASEITHKFVIDSKYNSKGIGLILGGTVLKGTIKLDQVMMFGPDRQGHFRKVVIKGIHENRVGITEAGEMSSICVNVKTVGKAEPIRNS
jgi:GTPase